MNEEIEVSNNTKRQFRVYTTLLEIAEERGTRLLTEGYYVPEAKKIASPLEFERSMPDLERQIFYLDDTDEQKKALGIHCNFGRDKVDENLVNKYLDIWKA